MSTTWHVTAEGADPALIQQRLDALEQTFSNWRPDSEVCRFNASRSTDWQPISRDLANVLQAAKAIAMKTDGALDVTLAPVIDAWGFGPAGRVTTPPSDEALNQARAHVGWQRVEVEGQKTRKLDAALAINLSTLVEGYAADEVSALLSARGVTVHLVQVGGAIVAKGKPWSIGVQRPEAAPGEAMQMIPLQDQAISTAGTYRQHFEHEEQTFAHIIDPRTLRPVTHGVVSVSVVAPTALRADAWDTALLVLGSEQGRATATREGLDTMFVEEQ